MSEHPMVLCENLVKIYKTDEIEVVALQGLDLVVQPGELMAIIGNSGSGKSTLLNMIGGLDKPSAGRLLVDGKDLVKMTPKDMIPYVRQTVGFVWQNNARNLIPYLTARENVELPMTLNGKRDPQRALELLEMVDIAKRGTVSWGDVRRRTAAGRHCHRLPITNCFCDEPRRRGYQDLHHIVDVFHQGDPGAHDRHRDHTRSLSKRDGW
ncbi:MAG: ABC transporter ATP-binding protein [Oscillospiraceae bacterium]